MKSLGFLALFFFLTTTMLVYKFVIIGEVEENYDGRTAVVVSQNEVNYIREEMRVFLKSFHGITAGISSGNYEMIEKAAHRSGKYVRDHAPGTLVGKIPLRFKSLGFDTQDRFDELAESAKAHKDTQFLLSELSGIMKNCAACHNSYTFSVVEP